MTKTVNKLSSYLTLLHPTSLKHLSNQLQGLVKGRLWLKVLIGIVLGIVVGSILGPSVGWVDPDTSKSITGWLAFPGNLFLSLVQMIVVPLVFASIICGLAASENLTQLKQMGFKAVLFFVLTTVLATGIGMALALIIQPGSYMDPELVRNALGEVGAPVAGAERAVEKRPLVDSLISILPVNPLGALAAGEMLQVVIFSIILGAALVSLVPSQSQPMISLLNSLQQVCMVIVRWALHLAPYAVFGLMTQLTSKLGLNTLVGLSVYVGTVLVGLFGLLLVYLIIVSFWTNHKPWAFLKAIREVQLLAFSTSSTAAVMPLSIKTAEEKLKIRSSISQFVIPVGATINMNGTALYQGVAVIFLAQLFGIELSIGQLGLVIVTAVAASIGSPATPGVGIVILSMVLNSVGVPAAGIGLLIGVDRILDMSRTSVNVTGDLVATAVLDRWVPQSKEE